MIILHNPYDKISRDFITAYGDGHTILDYPDCVNEYPYISAFPSVVVDVPAYCEPETTVKDDDGNDVVIPAYNVEAHIELLRTPNDWDEVETYVKMVNDRAISNPIQS